MIMFLSKKLVAAALFAIAPLAAHAGLTTISSGWPPAGSSGIESVAFQKVDLAGGGFVALGAHAYKNSQYLPNNGTDTFYAQSGTYAEPGKSYANWSFDYVYSKGDCTLCQVFLEIDKDPGVGVNYTKFEMFPAYDLANSWNMEMGFLTAIVYDFDPFSASSTSFRLSMVDPTKGDRSGNNPLLLGAAEITVNVPEPGTLALAGLALMGMALVRRRKN